MTPELRPIDAADAGITVTEAAAALGRSRSWVRDRIATRHLAVTAERPVIRISTASLLALRARLLRETKCQARAATHLRLVVDNTVK